jgi:hypothetical protein
MRHVLYLLHPVNLMNSNSHGKNHHLSLVDDEFKLAPHRDAAECAVSGGCSSVALRFFFFYLSPFGRTPISPKTDIIPLERILLSYTTARYSLRNH